MSAAPGPRAPVAVLREAVRRAVVVTSTYQVSAAIGMSERWVRKFLDGAEPKPATLDLLNAWHESYRRRSADAALEALLDGVPDAERGKVRESVLDLLREAHRKLGTDPPGWLVGK